jgi:hypothetical protein
VSLKTEGGEIEAFGLGFCSSPLPSSTTATKSWTPQGISSPWPRHSKPVLDTADLLKSLLYFLARNDDLVS